MVNVELGVEERGGVEVGCGGVFEAANAGPGVDILMGVLVLRGVNIGAVLVWLAKAGVVCGALVKVRMAVGVFVGGKTGVGVKLGRVRTVGEGMAVGGSAMATGMAVARLRSVAANVAAGP